MSKEMIISVNGREKKIAILDNGKVTEFYIERGGEENSGVVGNIYKGRVQRVLPGMQSAFVEIGLERDAFLYVSDFFDEEEEIERIMMEKGKKVSPEEIKREADDKIARSRMEREKHMEAAQEIAEPLVESGAVLDEDEIDEIEAAAEEASVEEIEEIQVGAVEDAETSEFAETAEQKKQRKNRRDRKREKRLAEQQSQQPSEESGLSETSEETPLVFETEDSNFERVIDDEDTGEMFKDAYRQEAIVDKVRAVEFDMESTATAEVGSLINEVSESGFERIADEEESETGAAEPKKSKNRRGSRGGRGRNKSGEKSSEAVETVEAEQAQETEPVAVEEANAEPQEKKKSSSRGRRGGSAKNKAEASEEAQAAEPVAEVREEAKETAAEKLKSRGKSSRSKRTNSGGKKGSKTEKLEDSEASVKESSDTAEMAVRRGGRGGRGRRGGGSRGRAGAGSDKPQERYEGSEMGESAVSETEIADVDFVEAAPKTGYQGGGNGNRDSRGGGRDNRDSRGGRDRSQPTITDLLREGQEILVQIAKEPIARKGARITSHIALPGRFLVYMPTIEHLGVSRKIESSNERGRLRVLIQKIKQEEDVPSGGFIVRTAGIGISEEDLRQDARYLVRTWLDIKRQAEKSKSPALVHQDLDIIQRILRDQLSDDFAAIRVDSEEEYLRIVEFINRIQPRLVKRVKLYTREEPILEAYAVQEEVDKALKPRVWLKSGGYLVINQTEALVAIDVNTGKFVGKGNARLEDTITKTNMEAVDEIARQIRLRDLGGIIVLDLIDMEDRRNRNKVAQALQEALASDKSPTKVLSFNDFGLIIMTRKRVKQSLERTMCAPCDYCQGAGWVKSPQTVCYEILEEARRLSRSLDDVRQTTLRVHPDVAVALRGSEREVLEEIEAYLGATDITSDKAVHQEQFDFAFI
ncbi:MAG TPA: Rne/Rng family ribonuclease [Pyrinomonadaceae bacterium]|nr:Rne/Rng family ribonuclease [Pyrinomonadaceae bacterium]